MSLVTRSLPALLLVAFATSFLLAAAQSDLSQFDERRRELRERWLNATSAQEKQQILQEFRDLEASFGIDPGSLGGSTEDLIEALLKGLGALVSNNTNGGGSTGLGTDDKTAKVQELVQWSQLELSQQMTPDWGALTGSNAPAAGSTLKETSKDLILRYKDYRMELEAWLAEGLKPGRSWSDAELQNWGKAATETGASRAILANMLRQHYSYVIKNYQVLMAAQKSTLDKERAVLEKVTNAIKKVDEMQETVAFVLKMKDAYELVERIAGSVVNPSEIPAAVLDQALDALDKTDDFINDKVAIIAKHLKKEAIQVEGYESVDDLVKAIKNTIEAIEINRGMIDYYVEKMKVAAFLESAKYYGKK